MSLVGCTRTDESEPISAKTGKFRVADDKEDKAPSSKRSASGEARRETAGSNDDSRSARASEPEEDREAAYRPAPPVAKSQEKGPQGKSSRGKSSPDRTGEKETTPNERPKATPRSGAQGSKAGEGKAGAAPGPRSLPPVISGDQLNAPKIPTGGSAAELLAFIEQVEEKLEAANKKGFSRDAIFAQLRPLLEAQVLAATEVFSNTKLEKESRQAAVAAKLRALSNLRQLETGAGNQEGVTKWTEDLQRFATPLRRDKDPVVARDAEIQLLGLLLEAIDQGRSKDFEPIIRVVKVLLKNESRNADVLLLAQQIAAGLRQMELEQEGMDILKETADAFADHEDPRLVDSSYGLRDFVSLEDRKFYKKVDAAIAREPGTAAEIVKIAAEMLDQENPSQSLIRELTSAAQALEISEEHKSALDLLALLESASKRIDASLETIQDKNFLAQTQEFSTKLKFSIRSGRRRIGLLGKPLVVEGVHMDGSPFDWQQYKGKVVLVSFWTTMHQPCLVELRNLQGFLNRYQDRGLELVGINLNRLDDPDERQHREQFFTRNSLPWPNIQSQDPAAQGFDSLMAVRCGVDLIPFTILIDRTGKVEAINLRGEGLHRRLASMFGQDLPGTESLPKRKSSMHRPGERRTTVFLTSYAATGFSQDGAEPAGATPGEVNPYQAPADYSTSQLVNFLLDMQEKPRSIQARRGFAEAVVDAADRVLSDSASKEKLKLLATLAKLHALRERAADDTAMEDRLARLLEQLQADPRPKVAAEVRFLGLERRVLAADGLPLDQIPGLLEEVRAYCEKERLVERHLQLASATVHAINRLESSEEREKLFTQFGKTFATSKHAELASYGRKLAKAPAALMSDLVGKPLELRGATTLGADFDWASYRGKVVLVDFWATWCGPCRREMPHVRQLYEKLKDQGFDVVGVNLDEDLDAVAEYLKQTPLPWTTLAGEETRGLAEKYGVRGIPLLILVDQQGDVVTVAHQVSALADAAEKLLPK